MNTRNFGNLVNKLMLDHSIREERCPGLESPVVSSLDEIYMKAQTQAAVSDLVDDVIREAQVEPKLEDSGFHIEEETVIDDTPVIVFRRGQEIFQAHADVFRKMVEKRRKSVTDYYLTCGVLSIPVTSRITELAVTTSMLAERYIDYEERRAEFLKKPLAGWSSNPAKNTTSLKNKLQVINFPASLPHVHKQHNLMGYSEHESYPELNEEWRTFFESHRKVGAYRTKRERVSVPRSEETSVSTLIHPSYGACGEEYRPAKQGVSVYVHPRCVVDRPTRSYVSESHIPAALIYYDRHSPASHVAAIKCRAAAQPVPDELMDIESMEPYIQAAVEHLIDVLEEDGLKVHSEKPSIDYHRRWLASNRTYSASKKIKKLDGLNSIFADDGHLKNPEEIDFSWEMFIKAEGYLKNKKGPRAIMNASDSIAALFGPMMEEIGDVFFSQSFTSKKIPEYLRPRFALKRFPNSVLLNDMTSFEGSINKELKLRIEHKIYEHFFPTYKPWLDKILEDKYKITSEHTMITLPNMRMSGDPQTSLGNSITNIVSIWASWLYARHQLNHSFPYADDLLYCPNAWVEGDDSLVDKCHVARWAQGTEFGDSLNDQFWDTYREGFIKMGFATKMEDVEFVGDAGYCSMFFDMSGKLSPSVAQTLIDFPWSHHGQYNNISQLLGLKASSLLHTAPGQPITSALVARYLPEKETKVAVPFNTYLLEEYQREGYTVEAKGNQMVVTVPPGRSIKPSSLQRHLFKRRYHVSNKKQIQIEEDIRRRGLREMWDKHRDVLDQICEIDGLVLSDLHAYYEQNINQQGQSLVDQGYSSHAVMWLVEDGHWKKVDRKPAKQEGKDIKTAAMKKISQRDHALEQLQKIRDVADSLGEEYSRAIEESLARLDRKRFLTTAVQQEIVGYQQDYSRGDESARKRLPAVMANLLKILPQNLQEAIKNKGLDIAACQAVLRKLKQEEPSRKHRVMRSIGARVHKVRAAIRGKYYDASRLLKNDRPCEVPLMHQVAANKLVKEPAQAGGSLFLRLALGIVMWPLVKLYEIACAYVDVHIEEEEEWYEREYLTMTEGKTISTRALLRVIYDVLAEDEEVLPYIDRIISWLN